MKVALLCAALIAAPAFAADLVAYNGRDSVRLADSPCQSEQVLTHVLPQMHSQFRAATAVVDGRTYAACWRVMGPAAHLLYEDGDQGLIPLTDLKPGMSA